MFNQVTSPYVDHDSVMNNCSLFGSCSRFVYGGRDECFGPDEQNDCWFQSPPHIVWTAHWIEETDCDEEGNCLGNWAMTGSPVPDFYHARTTVAGCSGS
jgi:hypothetical protein